MVGKTEIYIRIDSDDDGYCGWWSFDPDGESYLVDGRALWTTSKTTGEEYTRGTACTSVKQAKSELSILRYHFGGRLATNSYRPSSLLTTRSSRFIIRLSSRTKLCLSLTSLDSYQSLKLLI